MGFNSGFKGLMKILRCFAKIYAGYVFSDNRFTTLDEERHDAFSFCNIRDFLAIKLTRCTSFSNLFLQWNSTCFGKFLCPSSGVFHFTHSNGMCNTGLLTACKQDQDGTQFHPDPACKLSANLYDIYHCCGYSEKLPTMGRGTYRNM